MDINVPASVKFVLSRLEECGYEAFIAGGCVRDSLMGMIPHDYDIATNARPEQVTAAFSDSRVIETGIKHGTVTVVSQGKNIEITTYRIDGHYSDFRRPESVTFSDSLEEDLSRRDFTVNAMAYSDKTGIIDRFGGQKDLFSHTIKCVGDPRERFGEDALRIMRAIRFASQLGFSIENRTAFAIHEAKELLKNISAERIASELEKTVCGSSPAVPMLGFTDVFTEIIPEFAPCVDFDQHSKYHAYDVWEHTVRALQSSENSRAVRLALLFHDIEKPSCFCYDDEGMGHFPSHERKSAETAEKIMRRLKFDNNIIKKVGTLIRYHYITPIDDSIVIKRLLSRIGESNLADLMEVMKGDSRAKQPFCLERVAILDKMKVRMYEIVGSGECFTLGGLAFNGNDAAGIGFDGKGIGEVLEMLLSDVIEERVPNTHEALMNAAREYYSEYVPD